MVRRTLAVLLAAAVTFGGSALLLSPPAAALSAGLYTVTTDGSKPALSATGRFVAFLSSAQLTADDTNQGIDAYVRDVQTSQLTRVSDERGANEVDISDDGRRVVFRTVIGPHSEAFVRDLPTGELINVTRGPSGQPANSGVQNVVISGDGRAVAFHTQASNIVPGTGPGHDIFVRRVDSQVVEVASRSEDGTFANGSSTLPQLSYDGRRAGFVSDATNLTPGDTDPHADAYVKDLDTGSVPVVNFVDRRVDNLTMNADGTRLAFNTSFISNAFPAGLYLHDFQTAVTSLVNPGPCLSLGRPRLDGAGTRMLAICGGSPVLTYRDLSTGVELSNQTGNFAANAVSADGDAIAWEELAANKPIVRLQRLTNTDDTPPEVSYELSPGTPDGDNGWYRSDVSLTWRVDDPDSPVTVSGCVDAVVAADQGSTDYRCTATSDGGSTGPVTATVKRDATPPSISATVEPPAPDGDAGWYVSAPLVDFECSDAVSGVAECPEARHAVEGNDTVSGIARDAAGNTAGATTEALAVDLTDPVVGCPDAPVFAIGSSASLTATVTDDGSGPAVPSVTVGAPTDSAGSFTVEVTGRDVAGRSTTVDCAYVVSGYTFKGFFHPVNNDEVNVTKAGLTVPLRWRVLDAAGEPVTTLSTVTLQVTARSCVPGAPRDLVERVTLRRSGLVNVGHGFYQYNWATPKSYARTCQSLTLDLGDGQLHTAEFRFL